MKNKSFIVCIVLSSFLNNGIAFAFGGGVLFMKEIQLTQGYVTLVDDADYEWLNQWKWYARKNNNVWYASRQSALNENKKQSTIAMHRLILGVTDPKIQVDHEDTNGLNNQRHNLREATKSQNQHNQRIKTGGTSKYKGVHKHADGKWHAQITCDLRKIYLGLFSNEKDAAEAYNKAAIEHHKEFARLNKVS